MSAIDMWGTEIPVDVLSLILTRAFMLAARRCVCGRPILFEAHAPGMTSLMMVCKRWKVAHRRMVFQLIHSTACCAQPIQCARRYVLRAPRMLGLLISHGLATGEPIVAWPKHYKNPMVLRGTMSANAEKPVKGTEN